MAGSRDGVTALHIACFSNNFEGLKLLLAHTGIDVNVTNLYRTTALQTACSSNNLEGLKLLLAHPSMKSHNVRAKDGKTPLDIAIHHSSMDCIKELLKDGRVK